MATFRFTAGPWNIHEGNETFGPGHRKSIPLEEKMKRVLICCHGGIIRAFLAYIKGLEIKDFWNSHQPNCSVNILEVKNQKIRILEEHKIYYTLPEEKKGSIL